MQRQPGHRIAALLLFCACAGAAAPAGADEPSAEALAQKMLDAIGGRAAWSALTNTINGSEQYRAGEPTTVYSVITIDFERPRVRIETMAPDLYLVRVIDGDNHWRMTRAGEIEDGRPGTVAGDRRWYAAHLYRTLHRIASRDAALSLNVDADGRLEIFEGGKRLLWFRLNARGEPYAFGTWDDDTGSLTGPWNFVRDGIHHPAWVSNTDGSWRASVRTLTINVPLRDAMFARPAE